MGGSFSIDLKANNDEITTRLQIRQTIITVLLSAHFLGILYLICQTLVTGYAVVTTPAGTTAVPHAVWLLAPILTSFVVALTTRFEMGLYLDTLSAGIYYAYGVLVASIITNAVAVGLFSWEIGQGVSNFYVQSFGFLIATLIVTILFLVIEIVLIGAIYLFRRDLLLAISYGWTPAYKETSPLYTVTRPKEKQESLLPERDTQSQIRKTAIYKPRSIVKQ
jgi:hypothetical protein